MVETNKNSRTEKHDLNENRLKNQFDHVLQFEYGLLDQQDSEGLLEVLETDEILKAIHQSIQDDKLKCSFDSYGEHQKWLEKRSVQLIPELKKRIKEITS